jgi:Kef-type K+ transport system membrane component KefB
MELMEAVTATHARSFWHSAALYTFVLAASVASFLLIRRYGDGLAPGLPAPATPLAARQGAVDLVAVLLAIVTIVAAAQLAGRLFARFRQPAVVGEIVAGLVLGPSVLGAIAPRAMQTLLPASVAPVLSVLSQVGVILYMFLIGLHLDTDQLRRRSHASVAISHASIVAPFLLGTVLALLLYRRLGMDGVPFTAFALFCGVAMSVTAFPVLARILQDQGLASTRIGVVAIACAAVDDVTAWCLLALVIGFVKSDLASASRTLALTAAYIALMLAVVKPRLGRAVARRGDRDVGRTALAVVLLALLVSSLATELIGIHAIFGAFLLGAVIPAESRLARELTRRIEDVVVVLLLPIFFAYTGTRVRIGLLQSPTEWLLCGLIVATACAGKFGGSAVAARLTGLGWRESAALGILMNTRGLVELIVLNIGLDLGVLSPTLFTMLVVMAVVTTAMTSPVLSAILAGRAEPRIVSEEAGGSAPRDCNPRAMA